MVHDLRALPRAAEAREPDPTAMILDGRTLRSTPESGHRAGVEPLQPAPDRGIGDAEHPGDRAHAVAAMGTPHELRAFDHSSRLGAERASRSTPPISSSVSGRNTSTVGKGHLLREVLSDYALSDWTT